MLRAALLLCVPWLAGCAKDPVRAPAALVELGTKADAMFLFCQSGHHDAAANRTLAAIGCTGAFARGRSPYE